MTRYQPLAPGVALAAVVLLLAVLIVVSRCLTPAQTEPPAAPTATIAVIVVDPTPRLAGSPRPHWSPTPEPTERLPMVTIMVTRTETPMATPTSTPEPTKKPMSDKVERG